MRKPLLAATVGGLVLCICAAVTAAAARLPVASGELSAFQITDVTIPSTPPTTATFDAARDTFVDQRSPTTANGALGSLASTNGTKRVPIDGTTRRVQNAQPLVAFDLSTVCATADVVSATLELTATTGSSSNLSTLVLDIVGSTWPESTTTWATAPAVVSLGRGPTVTGTTVSFDVADTLVDSDGHLDPTSNAALHGWRISQGFDTVFASSEASAAIGPRLIIETGPC